jgi:1,2-phenylacetyl-CoA epoxidase catalytic subunit
MDNKFIFKGTITSIQPRIRLTRSFDEASHTYLGYAIKIAGTIDDEETTFSIGIGKAAQAKFNLKVNDVISGKCLSVPDPDSNVNYKVDHHDNQIFDHPEAKFFVV